MSLEGTWKLDPAHSTLGFVVRHAGISKVRGHFAEATGSVTHDGDEAAVEVRIPAASFTTGVEDRDNHIRSADFLDVENYPELLFTGKFTGEELVGDITIHGVTRPITFEVELTGEATDPFGNQRVGAEATARLSRKEFGLTWNADLPGMAGGVLVSDRVNIELDLSFIKTTPEKAETETSA